VGIAWRRFWGTGPETARAVRCATKESEGSGLAACCSQGVLREDFSAGAADRGLAEQTGRSQVNGYQMLLSMNAASCVFDNAPTFCASSVPFLNSISVGMPRTLYLGGVTWFSSMLSFATLRRPA